ncbi:MAG: acetate/propionate family kinase [Pseudomonadota bacterium]
MESDRAVLVVNAGSSSIKLAVFGTDGEAPLLSAMVERIGSDAASASVTDSAGARRNVPLQGRAGDTHEGALSALLPVLAEASSLAIAAVGHRIVHGGATFSSSVTIDAAVLATLEKLIPLARTHQPHGLAAIRAVTVLWPDVMQVACFDTAFHTTIPEKARTLALPRTVRDAGVRRYGFHGLSYRWIAQKLKETLGGQAAGRFVVAHLGNGASLCGMVDGQSRATTMGFTPLDGLVMGERPGLTDPGAVLFMVEEMGMDVDALRNVLFKQSGLLGLSGLSNDMRVLLASPSPEARLAVEVYVHRVVREVGAMAAEIGGLDGLVFTGGVGEHASFVRGAILERLAFLGLRFDVSANEKNAPRVSPQFAPPILVIAANEEAVIASDTRLLYART